VSVVGDANIYNSLFLPQHGALQAEGRACSIQDTFGLLHAQCGVGAARKGSRERACDRKQATDGVFTRLNRDEIHNNKNTHANPHHPPTTSLDSTLQLRLHARDTANVEVTTVGRILVPNQTRCVYACIRSKSLRAPSPSLEICRTRNSNDAKFFPLLSHPSHPSKLLHV
jgi:hypothetical protein